MSSFRSASILKTRCLFFKWFEGPVQLALVGYFFVGLCDSTVYLLVMLDLEHNRQTAVMERGLLSGPATSSTVNPSLHHSWWPGSPLRRRCLRGVLGDPSSKVAAMRADRFAAVSVCCCLCGLRTSTAMASGSGVVRRVLLALRCGTSSTTMTLELGDAPPSESVSAAGTPRSATNAARSTPPSPPTEPGAHVDCVNKRGNIYSTMDFRCYKDGLMTLCSLK